MEKFLQFLWEMTPVWVLFGLLCWALCSQREKCQEANIMHEAQIRQWIAMKAAAGAQPLPQVEEPYKNGYKTAGVTE